MKENFDQWVEFLKPENLKGNLISCALFIANFESFKENTTETIKSLYNTGFDGQELTYSPNYQTEVLIRNPSPLKATLLWLKAQDAIDDEDLNKYEEVKRYRNELAHQMLNLLFEGLEAFGEKYSALITLQIKIDRWWLLNIEIPTNPDFDDTKIDEAGVMTASEIRHKLMLDILTGDDETANYYYKEFIKHKKTFG